MHPSKSRTQRLCAAICVEDIDQESILMSEDHAYLMGWSPVIYNLAEIVVDFFKSDIEGGLIGIILVNDLRCLGRLWDVSDFIQVLDRCSRRQVLVTTHRMIFNPADPGDWVLLLENAFLNE